MPGIFIINLDARMSTVLEDLILIAGASHSDEYLDQIIYVPLS